MVWGDYGGDDDGGGVDVCGVDDHGYDGVDESGGGFYVSL